METWRSRARRFPFTVHVELTDMETETQILGRTTDLSLYGCRVKTEKPFPTREKVWIKIAHEGANFVAAGRVASMLDGEMGIVFTKIEENDQSVLDKWIAELRERGLLN